MSAQPPESRRSVIHDLGYRPYEGPRLGQGAVIGALFLTGLRNVFGLGRSGKSKVLPWILLGLNLLPALIMVGVLVMIGLDRLPVNYARYASTTQVLVSIFVAAQAPILFSHDQRHGSIVLYLARPLRATTYGLVRLASLWAAVLAFVVLPVLLLYVGALLAELDFWEQTTDALTAVMLAIVLAGMVSGISGLIASWSIRRGFAVVATMMVLLVGDGIAAIVQGISYDQGQPRIGEVAGLFTPYTLYRGLVQVFDFSSATLTPPGGGVMSTAYVVVALGLVLACTALIAARFRKIGDR